MPTQEEQQVEALITEFDEWFQGKGNEPLVRPELAILKSYSYWLLHFRSAALPGVVVSTHESSQVRDEVLEVRSDGAAGSDSGGPGQSGT